MTSTLPVTPSTPAGIKILTGERTGHVVYPLQAESSLGRLKSVTVFLPDLKASRNHAMILWDRNSRWILMDLSSNGTFLNGERVPRASDVPLTSGDQIRIGATEMEFRTVGHTAPATPPPAPPPAPLAAKPATQAPASVPAPVPVAAAAEPPPVEYVFDFTEDEDPQVNLNKVFEDTGSKKWESTATQSFSIEALKEQFGDDQDA